MQTAAVMNRTSRNRAVPSQPAPKKAGRQAAFQIADRRPETRRLTRLQGMANSRTQGQQFTQLQAPEYNTSPASQLGPGLEASSMHLLGTSINRDSALERKTDTTDTKSLNPNYRSSKPVQLSSRSAYVIQRQPEEGETSAAGQDLLDLADQLQQNKSKIESVDASAVEGAINLLRQAVQFADDSTISLGLKKIEAVAQNSEARESESGTAQLASWAFKGAVIGAILGTIVPVIGNILGGIYGYKKGKQWDLDQLTTDGATNNEINTMMAIEPSAYVIHTQITAEAANSPTLVCQLYTDGFTPAEITALLAVESNAQTIHNYWTTAIPGFTLGNLNFASVASGKVGSIYFNGGRIRLIHRSQPEVSARAGVIRTTMSAADVTLCRAYWKNGVKTGLRSVAQFYAYAQNRPSFQMAAAGVGGKIVEFWATGWHPSRGTPTAFNYINNQSHLNIVANVANLNSNNTLRAWMRSIVALRAIPMN